MPDKILIVNGSGYAEAIRGLGEMVPYHDEFYTSPEDFKLIMFTGGADISPQLYGDTSPSRICNTNPSRDKEEVAIFELALKHNIKMTGICRGSQFINIMSGGRMMHHIDGHGLMGTHGFQSWKDDKPIQVTSTHHQMMVPGPDGLIIGWSDKKLSKRYIGKKDESEFWAGPEVEAILYPKTNCMGVQYHPEYMHRETEGYLWYFNAVKDFLELSMDEFVQTYFKQGKEDVLSAG